MGVLLFLTWATPGSFAGVLSPTVCGTAPEVTEPSPEPGLRDKDLGSDHAGDEQFTECWY